MEPGRPRLRGRAGVYMRRAPRTRGGERGACNPRYAAGAEPANPTMRRTRSLHPPLCGGRGACTPRYAAGAEHANPQNGGKSGVLRSDTFDAKTSLL